MITLPMSKRALHTLFLAFALLFAQQGAAWHALSHLGGAPSHTQHDKKSQQGEQCIKCAVFSQLGAACTSTPLAHDLLRFCSVPPLQVASPYFRLTPQLYQSRAPPIPV